MSRIEKHICRKCGNSDIYVEIYDHLMYAACATCDDAGPAVHIADFSEEDCKALFCRPETFKRLGSCKDCEWWKKGEKKCILGYNTEKKEENFGCIYWNQSLEERDAIKKVLR